MNEYNVNHLKINPQDYQHPVDKKVTEGILKMPAFQKVLQYISKNSMEKYMSSFYRSSLAQLTPEVAPKIFKMLEEAAKMYDVPVIPDVFIERTYPMMVVLHGVEKPTIRISTTLLESLSEQALWGLMASEMSGIKTGFCEIKLVEWLCNSTVGLIPDVLSVPLKVVFNNWHKYAEFSFDRANLLATGDINTTMQGMLAGEAPSHVLQSIDFSDPNCEYMKQCREFIQNDDKEASLVRNYNAVVSNYAFYASRYVDLFRFYQTEYHDLMDDYLD